MTPAAIIRKAQADGVKLALSPAGTIKATGDAAAVNRWLATLKAHKLEILATLKAANDTARKFDADAITESHEERAAILEYDAGLEREQAEHEAWRCFFRDGTLATVYPNPPMSRRDMLERYPALQDLEPLPPAELTGELSRKDEAHLRAWLALIGEADEAMICAVLEQCRADGNALQYYLSRARGCSSPG